MKVAVIGCGYVGLITAVGLAYKGHKVVSIDIDNSRVEKIKLGKVPFQENGVERALKKCLKKGNLVVSSNLVDIAQCEVVLVCVQTPPKPDGAIDLKILKEAIRSLVPLFLKYRLMRTVVIRSTVIPGTTDGFVTPLFNKIAAKTNLAFNPEFLREGSAWDDFFKPDRIVIGSHSNYASRQLKKLYAPFGAPIISTTPSTAELAKYTSNTLLATLISFSNEIARICEHTPGTDVEDVLGIIYLDKRFHSNGQEKPGILSYLKAGCGFGGSCFPKDLSALIDYASSKGEKPQLLKAVKAVNDSQSTRVVDIVSNALGGLNKRRITVLGAAFKGGTDDLRESPGLRIVDKLLRQEAIVSLYDPLVKRGNLKSYQDKGVNIASTIKEAVETAHACIIASNASEFRELKLLKKLLNKDSVIIDTRRILKICEDSAEKFYAIGRAKNSVYIF